jgi:putative phosphoserine phosphatase / 1-acylglycerol-3-phosphate O-acyltransferase
MSEHRGAVFVDLDRTLIRSASGPVFHDAMVAEGVLPEGQHLPGDRLLYRLYDLFGESVPFIALARAAATVMKGRSAEATRRAGKRSVEALVDLVQPFALETLAAHRQAARPLVLATTSPHDLVTALADALGFDGVIATRYEESGGRYTGRLDDGFVWGPGKRAAAGQWAAEHGCELRASDAYSDSIFDTPLFHAVGHPHPVNADLRLAALALGLRWPLDHWDRPPGVPSVFGLEPYHLARPFVRPGLFPYARFDLHGLEQIPARGPVLLASNHRSYFDVAALALVAARMGRPVRFLGKREIFDAPIVGPVARALGGIPVDRGSGSGAPIRAAAASLRAGEAVIVLPQGTIPRGDAFFDPVLKGRTGTARLAADTGAPVVPIGLWGTEAVWPRSAKLPDMTTLRHPRRVTVAIGPEVELGHTDAVADTEVVMAAIGDLLPPEAHAVRVPTPDELARTRPSA